MSNCTSTLLPSHILWQTAMFLTVLYCASHGTLNETNAKQGSYKYEREIPNEHELGNFPFHNLCLEMNWTFLWCFWPSRLISFQCRYWAVDAGIISKKPKRFVNLLLLLQSFRFSIPLFCQSHFEGSARDDSLFLNHFVQFTCLFSRKNLS